MEPLSFTLLWPMVYDVTVAGIKLKQTHTMMEGVSIMFALAWLCLLTKHLLSGEVAKVIHFKVSAL